ncbi:MAG TPA: hypothetical protein VIS51_10085 [Solirubrobacterales bacterium]
MRDTAHYDLDGTAAWLRRLAVSDRTQLQKELAPSRAEGGCSTCRRERAEVLRNAADALEALTVLADPKGPTADFELLYALTRRYWAKLVRVLRTQPEAHCTRHRDSRPPWCGSCAEKKQAELAGLEAALDTAWADMRAAGVYADPAYADKVAREVRIAEARVDRHLAKPCKHNAHFRERVLHTDGPPGPERPHRYRLDCPLCEQAVNDLAEALRDEYRRFGADRVDVDFAKQSIAAALDEPCTHLVGLADKMTGRYKRRAPAGPSEYCSPRELPSLADCAQLLGSYDLAAVARGSWALELRVADLDDRAKGGTGYSSVGLDYEAWADEASPNVVRSAFQDGSDPSASVEPLTEAEVVLTVEEELAAREAVKHIYGPEFAGFRHIEGGVADVLSDSDVAGARFRFSELLGELVKPTEARYDSSGMAETIERELHSSRPDGQVVLSHAPSMLMLRALKDRATLLALWDEQFVPPMEHMDDEPLALLGAWSAGLTASARLVMDPLYDQPCRWLAVNYPDELRATLVETHDRQARAGRERQRQLALELAHEASLGISRYRTPLGPVAVDEGEAPVESYVYEYEEAV